MCKRKSWMSKVGGQGGTWEGWLTGASSGVVLRAFPHSPQYNLALCTDLPPPGSYRAGCL